MNLELMFTGLSVAITVLIAVGSATWKLHGKFSADRETLGSQIATFNNALLSQIQLTEERLEQELKTIISKFDARTLEIERDLAQFKAYCERQFTSKDTFGAVMNAQSAERSAMRAELMDRFNRIEDRLPLRGRRDLKEE